MRGRDTAPRHGAADPDHVRRQAPARLAQVPISVARRLELIASTPGFELTESTESTEPAGLVRATVALTAWRPLDG
ncbi:hypothetical protein [Streptomyces sp. NBC_01506]|uniref:hypothetical protein n=1 Tax=Streptomyces sp. NBC_01506 TaxID=2903887 RepID=UPI003869AB16